MTAPGPPPMPNNRIEQEFARIWDAIRETNRKTLYSASISEGGLTVSGSGGIEVRDAEGDRTFFAGGLEAQWTRPDGKPQAATVISDDAGHWRVAVWDDNPTSGGYSQEVRIWDALEHVVVATDPAGGLAKPWTPVPMYCRYTPPAGPTIGYTHIPVANLASAQNIWEGRMDEVVSPRIEISGTWGSAIDSNTTTYTLQVNAQTVGSWVSTGIESTTRGPFDISQWLDYRNVSVRLLAQSTGSGNAACQVSGCAQRGS